MEEKACRKCKQNKPLDEFYNSERTKDGKRTECKECERLMHQKWAENNREKVREHSLAYQRRHKEKCKAKQKKWLKQHPEKNYAYRIKNRYGMSIEDYYSLVTQQEGKCAICGKTADPKLVVDHCHATNKVRGLLCDLCNRGIGHFSDSIELLKAAIQYLESHNGTQNSHSAAQ